VGTDELDVSGLSSERIGNVAAKLRIPIYASTTEVGGLEEVFFDLTARTDGQGAER
jgi:hypothetical protein